MKKDMATIKVICMIEQVQYHGWLGTCEIVSLLFYVLVLFLSIPFLFLSFSISFSWAVGPSLSWMHTCDEIQPHETSLLYRPSKSQNGVSLYGKVQSPTSDFCSENQCPANTYPSSRGFWQVLIWWFPESWGYLQSSSLSMGIFPINQPFWGTSILGHPHMTSWLWTLKYGDKYDCPWLVGISWDTTWCLYHWVTEVQS